MQTYGYANLKNAWLQLRQSPLISSIHAGKLRQQLRFTGRSEAIAFLEIIPLCNKKRTKSFHIVLCLWLHSCASRLLLKIALRVGEVY